MRVVIVEQSESRYAVCTVETESDRVLLIEKMHAGDTLRIGDTVNIPLFPVLTLSSFVTSNEPGATVALGTLPAGTVWNGQTFEHAEENDI